MKKISIIPLLLIVMFIFPMCSGLVSATSINPVLKITYTGDLIGSYSTQPDLKHFVVNSTSGTIDLYYIKGDEKIYKWNSGGSSATFCTFESAGYYSAAMTPSGGKIYLTYRAGSWHGFKVIDIATATVIKGSWVAGDYYTKSSIQVDSVGNAYAIYRRSTGAWYLAYFKYSDQSETDTDLSIGTTDGNNAYSFKISGTTDYLYWAIFVDTYCYIIQYKISTGAISKTTITTGTFYLDATYPIRVIEDSLIMNEAGQINGRLTLHGAPISGNGLGFYNIYCTSGIWNYEFRQYAPVGYDYPTRGNVWAYHSGSDTLCLSWYKDAYTTKQLYTATINYATSNLISSISVTIDPTTTEYPLSTQTVWASEYIYHNTAVNESVEWYYNHGYYPSTTGNYRSEFYSYGGTFTAFYTVSGATTETAEQPSGVYEIGGVDISATFNTSTGKIYYLRQPFSGNVTLSEIKVLINETMVNATCNHTFAFLIWLDNTLKYAHNVTTSANGTAIYTDSLAVLIASGGVVRAGIVSWGDNIDGLPLGIGWSANNWQTYEKDFSGNYADLSAIDWVAEGNAMTNKLAIALGFVSNYVAPQYTEGGGESGFSIVNGSIVINTNVNGSISEVTITDQTSPIGTTILNAFNSWGYGATAGGYILWVSFILGITMLMSKAGIGGMGALMTGFIGSSFICWGLGLVGATIIILSILVVIILASKEIVGLVRGG